MRKHAAIQSARSARSVVGASFVAAAVIALSAGGQASTGSREDFPRWLDEFAAEARAAGISDAAIQASLADVALIDSILEQDRSQPGAPGDFCGYLEKRLTDTRIARGKRMLDEHAELLGEISAKYGIPSRFIVALWGLETNFGDYMGDYRVMDALATLAYDPRRGGMFRKQLIAALRIVDEGHQQPNAMIGSWAGAMGQVQFMPTTFLGYAVDWDGDGRKDVWTSLPDALASGANYLRVSGWRSGQTWGREVRIPSNLNGAGRSRKDWRAVDDWQRAGVRRVDGGNLPSSTLRGSLVVPARDPSHAFLVYSNFQTILRWNNSTFFGISVGTLADELEDVASVRACRS